MPFFRSRAFLSGKKRVIMNMNLRSGVIIMKRIVTMQDLSCIGKCSLTVALPVLSAMGLECAMLPTAVLSAHTAFEGFPL